MKKKKIDSGTKICMSRHWSLTHIYTHTRTTLPMVGALAVFYYACNWRGVVAKTMTSIMYICISTLNKSHSYEVSHNWKCSKRFSTT